MRRKFIVSSSYVSTRKFIVRARKFIVSARNFTRKQGGDIERPEHTALPVTSAVSRAVKRCP